MKILNNLINRISKIIFGDMSYHPILFCFLSALSLIFSLVFAYQRIYGDAGFSLFTLINEERFVMISSRPISMVVEVLPLILVKMGVSIDKVLIAFTINEWLWYFLCALILFYIYKKPTYAIAIYLLQVFCLQWNWFNPVSELIIAFPLVFMFAAELPLLTQKKFSIFRILLLVTMIVFCHPLYSVLLPWMLFLFYLANYKSYKDIEKNYRILNVIAVLVILIHYFFLSGYDIKSATETNGLGLFKNLRLSLILSYIKSFPGLIALVILIVFFLRKNMRKKEMLLFLISTGGYFILVVHTYGHDFPDTYEPYERYLFPIAIIIGFYWFAVLKKSWNVLLLFIAFYNIIMFANYGNRVQTRYRQFNYMLTNAQQWDESKIYIRAENYYPSKIGHDWTMPNESLILSAMQSKGTAKQVWVKESITIDLFNELNSKNILASPYWTVADSTLNPVYFKIKRGKAVCANSDSIQSNKSDTFFSKISIEPIAPFVLAKNIETLIPIKITNRNFEPLCSGLQKENRRLSYHWEKDNKIIEWDGLRTPIAMDVIRTNTQLLKIKAPPISGEYYLVTDIVYEGKRWANLKGKYKYKIR